MKRKPKIQTAPTEEQIRDYAHHLFLLEGSRPGHELDHWLEAEACLKAQIPKRAAHSRLHCHFLGLVDDDVCTTEPGLKVLPL